MALERREDDAIRFRFDRRAPGILQTSWKIVSTEGDLAIDGEELVFWPRGNQSGRVTIYAMTDDAVVGVETFAVDAGHESARDANEPGT